MISPEKEATTSTVGTTKDTCEGDALCLTIFNDLGSLENNKSGDMVLGTKEFEWTSKLMWNQEFNVSERINLHFLGRRSGSNENLWRVEIPTEAWNLFMYGVSWPIEILSGYLLHGNSKKYPRANQVLPTTHNSIFQKSGVQICLVENEDEVLGQPPLGPSEIESFVEPASPESWCGNSIDEGEVENELLIPEECAMFLHKHSITKGVGRRNKLKALGTLAPERNLKSSTGRKRGRKPRTEVGSAILREVTEGSRGLDPSIASLQATAERAGAGGYFTRATKAWLLGKSVGLRYPGSDEEAIRGLAEELEEDRLGGPGQ